LIDIKDLRFPTFEQFQDWKRAYIKPYLLKDKITAQNADDILIKQVAKFTNDPLGFVLYAWDWGNGGLSGSWPEDWQLQAWAELTNQLSLPATRHNPIRLAKASGHGIGKSAWLSITNVTLMATYPHTRAITTANTEGQLRSKTWPELKKWLDLSIVSHWFEYTKTQMFVPGVDAENWKSEALTWSLTNTDAFAGAHNKGKRLFIAFDEASQIPTEIFDIVNGAMSDKDTQLIWVCFGNPTTNTGPFHGCFHSPTSRWRTQQIDSRDVRITNKDELQAQVDEYGEDSDFVRVRIRGIFPRSSECQAIPQEYIDAARHRVIKHESQFEYAPCVVGIDGSWTGEDTLEVYLRQGNYARHMLSIKYNDNDFDVVGKIIATVKAKHKYTVDGWIIDQGYGTGIYSAFKTLGHVNVHLVAFGGSAPVVGFANMTTWMTNQAGIWLRDGGSIEDPQLEQELSWQEMHTIQTGPRAGWQVLESKKDMAKRGLKSPNRSDAFKMTFALPIKKINAPATQYSISYDVVKDYGYHRF
jgi:hypothetical protein